MLLGAGLLHVAFLSVCNMQHHPEITLRSVPPQSDSDRYRPSAVVRGAGGRQHSTPYATSAVVNSSFQGGRSDSHEVTSKEARRGGSAVRGSSPPEVTSAGVSRVSHTALRIARCRPTSSGSISAATHAGARSLLRRVIIAIAWSTEVRDLLPRFGSARMKVRHQGSPRPARTARRYRHEASSWRRARRRVPHGSQRAAEVRDKRRTRSPHDGGSQVYATT